MKYFTLILLLAVSFPVSAADAESPEALSLIVMDPLAAPLSCPCVEGYAQRKYEVLAEHIKAAMGREVTLTFSESLEGALKKTNGRAELVIGKDSVVRADGADAKLRLDALCRLTDLKGATTQYGLIVVNRDDPAKAAKDLSGYTIIFGPSEAAEKHSAALDVLKAASVDIPKKLSIDAACSDGACKVIDLGPESRSAAVISSYAQPLLEGCGTIKKGDLRVVARTEPVPFITAFVSESLPEQDVRTLKTTLLDVAKHPEVLEALESLIGFVPVQDAESETQTVAKKK